MSVRDRFVSSSATFVTDAIGGLVASTPDLTWNTDGYLIRREPLPDGQVAIVSGGDTLHIVNFAIARQVAGAARSMSVALVPCTIPGAAFPSFDLGDNEMEIGIGIHGERGVSREPPPRSSIGC